MTTYFDNGRKQSEGALVNGLKVGEWVYYHESPYIVKSHGFTEPYKPDLIKSKGNFVDGEKNGLWINYPNHIQEFDVKTEYGWRGVLNSPDNIFESKGYYINGKKDGYWEEYSFHGIHHFRSISARLNYKNGELHGENIWYHYNRVIRQKGNFVDGKPDGIIIGFHLDSSKKFEETYVNGEMVSKKRFMDSSLRNEYDINGKRHGYWEYYNLNGSLVSKGLYINDKKHGVWENYFNNGEGNKVKYNLGNVVTMKTKIKEFDMAELYELSIIVDNDPIQITLDEIATKFGINVNQLKIKK